MRHIWLLAEAHELEQLRRRIRAQCESLGCFPELKGFDHPKALFDALPKEPPDCVTVSLPGVAGLNAVEYLRRLNPDCALIWASDLDFSLQAYRLRADQFILGPPEDEALREALSCCMERRSPLRVMEQ